MKWTAIASIIATACILTNATASLGDDSGDQNGQTNASGQSNASNKLYGGVSKFAILDDNAQSNLGIKCATAGDGFRIAAVVAGSEADKKGVQVGDLVLSAQADKNDIGLGLERGERIFYLKLKKTTQVAAQLTPMEARKDVVPAQTFPLQAERNVAEVPEMQVPQQNIPVMSVVPREQLQLLAKYDIELVVDQSMSMRRQDCPGDLSRWNWCGMQAADLARALAPYARDGITITTFAHDHQVYPHADPNGIGNLFANPHFQFGTYLLEALTDRFNAYFARRNPSSKPLLIAVITDGVPHPQPQPELVKQQLINATKYMTDPREITVAFLQIGGNDRFGKAYLTDLDLNLVKSGAKYDFVHTKNFDQLQRIGIGQALADSIRESLNFNKPALDPVAFPPRPMKQLGQMGRKPSPE